MHFGIFFHGRAEEAWEKVTKFSRKAWQQALVLLRVVRPTDGRLTDQYLLGGGGLSPLLPWCTEGHVHLSWASHSAVPVGRVPCMKVTDERAQSAS